MHTVRLDGEFAGGGGAFPFELTVPGGRVRAGGVTVIGILPPFRRRGLLSGLMRAQLEAMHERGEHVAYLWASEDRIYGRYGYGMASQTLWVDLSRDHAGFALPHEASGRVRSSASTRRSRPSRTSTSAWPCGRRACSRGRPLVGDARAPRPARPARRRRRARAVLYEDDGRADGYAIYRIHAHWENGLADGHVNVIEALGATPSATAAIWRYLLDVDWLQFVRARLLPVDHELTFLLAEPRHLRARLGEGLWVRLVDVGEALRARTYADLEPVMIEVADEYCPWNEGRWRVGPDGVERDDGEPDLRCDVDSSARSTSAASRGRARARRPRRGARGRRRRARDRALRGRPGTVVPGDLLAHDDRRPERHQRGEAEHVLVAQPDAPVRDAAREELWQFVPWIPT